MVDIGHESIHQRREARGREDRPAVQAEGPGLTFAGAVALYVVLATMLSVLGSCMVAI